MNPFTLLATEAVTISETEVVIVGGGIVGVSAALYLARAGVPVLVCEKGLIGAEQSSRNWGWIGRQKRAPQEMALCSASLDCWEEISVIAGPATGFRRTGMLHVCATEADIAREESWLRLTEGTEVDSHMIGRSALSNLLGQDDHPWNAALYTPSDGRADPRTATAAIATAAISAGANIAQSCAVRGIDLTAGHVTGVVTEAGRVACRSVILAGGAWSRLLLRSLGATLPQLNVVSSNQRISTRHRYAPSIWGQGFTTGSFGDGTATLPSGGAALHEVVPDSIRFLPAFLPLLKAARGHVRPRFGMQSIQGGHSLPPNGAEITPFERTRILSPAPDHQGLDEALRAFARALPEETHIPVLSRWAGCIEMVPDLLPVLSAVESVPGLLLSSSSGHGFGLGPVAGKVLAALASGGTAQIDLAAFRFGRFAERPRPRPAATL